MKAWAKVTLKLLEAEFPNFEITLAFQAFALHVSERKSRSQTQEEQAEFAKRRDKHLLTLCVTYDQNFQLVKEPRALKQ